MLKTYLGLALYVWRQWRSISVCYLEDGQKRINIEKRTLSLLTIAILSIVSIQLCAFLIVKRGFTL